MSEDLYVKFTALFCNDEIKRHTKYPVSLLKEKLSPEFSSGVPASLATRTIWKESEINGEKAYIFVSLIRNPEKLVLKDPYDTLMTLIAECKIKKNGRYTVPYLEEHFATEFQNGVPPSIAAFSRWTMTEEKGVKLYIYHCVHKYRGSKANAA